jgi:cholesterol oxidase
MAVVEHFDAVIVGSGFGGSVTAYRLAKEGLSVCLLERGKPYPPGSFARTPHAMSTNFWDPSAGLHGLYDIWSFRGLEALVSAGLGGGSLIYANVFLRKGERWFAEPGQAGAPARAWPIQRQDLEPHYDNVAQIIGLQRYPTDAAPYATTPKTVAFQQGAATAGVEWFRPPLAVTFGNAAQSPVPGEPIVEEKPNLHGRTRYTCRLVGECDLGCNFGSKNSLDYNYLTRAARDHGADIRTRSEVRALAPTEGRWEITYVEHAPENEGHATDTTNLPLRRLTAERLILSAGTLGTPFLLLRNRLSLPGLAPALGTRFCGNGDLLTFATHTRREEGGKRVPRLIEPSYGPVITSTVRVPDTADGGGGPGFYIQDGGYPALVSWLQESADVGHELSRAGRFLFRRLLDRLTKSPKSELSAEISRLIGDAERSATTLPMLGMGRDTADGVMRLRDGRYLDIDWTTATSRTYFQRVRETMQAISDALGGKWVENPLWRFHRVITVHPLGGCPMGREPAEGVVDSHGAVFNHPGLYIADGSVMPGPVGANPSFTIAALADRFADRILADHRAARGSG